MKSLALVQHRFCGQYASYLITSWDPALNVGQTQKSCIKHGVTLSEREMQSANPIDELVCLGSQARRYAPLQEWGLPARIPAWHGPLE